VDAVEEDGAIAAVKPLTSRLMKSSTTGIWKSREGGRRV